MLLLRFRSVLVLLLGAALAHAAVAQTQSRARHIIRTGEAPDVTTAPAREKAAFLGVETAPVPPALAAQLGLARDMGLVVTRLADDAPAAGVLQQHDVLKKLDDQLLVDSRQLSVLVRARKPGDEVRLTIVRGGKESVVTARLGERELPRVAGFRSLGDGTGFQFEFGDRFNPERLRELPGLAREELKDVFRILGHERGNWFAGPRVHVFRRQGAPGSTVLNLAEGNFVFSDQDGSVEVNASQGVRRLTVKDASGKVLFEGPITTEEERAALPPEVQARLQKLERTTIDFEAPEGLQPEGVQLAPPAPTKTRHPARPSAPAWTPARPL